MIQRLKSPLLLILLLAFALRLVNITERSLWYDEAFAVLFAEKGLDAMLYGTLEPVDGGASDIHPLLYYSTLNFWMAAAGQSPLAVRLWSVLPGLAAVVLLFYVGRELFDERTGLVGALIMAIAPFHVQYSQEVRMYSLLVLLLLGVTWCFIKGWRDESARQWRWWAAFGVLAGLAMYTQQLAAFYLMAIGLVPLLARRWRKLPYMALGTGIALIVYFPWLLNIPSQLEKVNSYYWIDQPGIATPFVTLYIFFTGFTEIQPPASLIALMGAAFILLFFLAQIALYLRKPRRRSESDIKPLGFVLWLFAAPIALMWLVSQVQPVYLDRALIGSAVMLYLALGWLFTRGGVPRIIAGLLALIGFTVAGIGLWAHYTFDDFPNSPFNDAVAHIRENQTEGDVVVHGNKLTALPMVYYGRDLDQRYIGDRPGAPEDTLALPTQEALQLLADACIAEASAGGERVWFVVFDRAESQYAAAGRTELSDAIGWLEGNYTLTDTLRFNDLLVYRYADPSPTIETDCS